jgi:hypothetical protein
MNPFETTWPGFEKQVSSIEALETLFSVFRVEIGNDTNDVAEHTGEFSLAFDLMRYTLHI